MPGLRLHEALGALNSGGYEVDDTNLAAFGEVSITARDPLTPRIGDVFTIESRERIYEVAVEVVLSSRVGWNASCKVLGLRTS